LLARAIRGYAAGVVSVQTIATLQGTTSSAVGRELREAGIYPADSAVTWAEPGELPEARVDLSLERLLIGTLDRLRTLEGPRRDDGDRPRGRGRRSRCETSSC
jgi:hypothetical protein